MKYLVFGAGGFLGNHLQRLLLESGEKVYCVKRIPDENSFNIDITRSDAFNSIDIIPDIIINCASALPDGAQCFNDTDYLRRLFETNVIGGANIINWANSKGVKKVINCSTLVVVNKPWPTPLKEVENTYPKGNHVGYSASKLSQELVMSSIAEATGIELLHVRISALYGPEMKGSGILHQLINKARAGEILHLNNGNNVSYDFLHVDDAVKAIYHLSRQVDWSDTIVNLASGEEITLIKLAEILCEITGNSKKNIRNVDSDNIPSRANVDTSLLEKYLHGSGINTKGFAEKIKYMIT